MTGVDGSSWIWLAGWLAGFLGALAAVLLWLNHRDRRRDRRAAERHRDAAFCAAHDIDWNATAPEKTR